jgi:hypothetical protein
MIKIIVSTNNYKPIIRFGFNGYIIHFDPTMQNDNEVLCSEDTIFVEKNTKDNLIKAIVEYKYSPEDVNLILSNTNNDETSERSAYLEWLDYAKKCASIIFDAPTLENAIKAKLEEITKYDVSSAVNGFYYQGNEYWLDKATRVGLMNSTRILKENGQTSTTLWFNDMCLTLPVDDVIDKLSALEQYALSCYNVTASHKIAVQALTTIDEVN